jgi:hypothetical protein
LLELLSDPEDRGDMFLRNFSIPAKYTALQPTRNYSTNIFDVMSGVKYVKCSYTCNELIKKHVVKTFGGIEVKVLSFLAFCTTCRVNYMTLSNQYINLRINHLKPSGLYHLLYHAKTLHSAHTVYLCAPYGSHNKQRLVPQTALTGWAL